MLIERNSPVEKDRADGRRWIPPPTFTGNVAAESLTELRQAEAEIEQGRAGGKAQEEQDLTDLEKARYDVQRAKLEVSKAEILSKIDRGEKQAALADAEQREGRRRRNSLPTVPRPRPTMTGRNKSAEESAARRA